MAVAPAEKSSAPAAAPSRRRGARLSPQARLVLALLVLAVSTYFAMTQRPRPDAYRQPSVLSREWWLYPFEWNPPARLPAVGRDLKDVHAIPDTATVYAVGELGTVLVSTDGGETWQTTAARTPLPTPGQTATPAASQTPAGNTGANAPPARIPSGQTGPASVAGKTLAGVYFYNEREGFVVTDSDDCITTSDGGASWAYYDVQELPPTDRYYEPLNGAVRYAGPSALPRVIWLTVTQPPTVFRVDPAPASSDSAAARRPGAEDSPNRGTRLGANPVIFIDTQEELWLVAGNGLSHSTDGGRTWEVSKSGIPEGSALRSVFFVEKSRGWAVGDRGVVVATNDGGKTWAQQGRGATEQDLKALSFHPDGLRGWVVGDAGTILYTEDGGATWVHQAQPRGRGSDGRPENAGGVSSLWLPAPWYYVSWMLVALLLPVRRTAVVDLEEEPETSVADVLVSDRPLEEGDADTIEFKPIALGLSRFLRNENTKPPLTIAVTGEWGTGKSSLMNLLRADLRRYGFRPVWFNAWHHQKEEHLLASLLQNVRLQAVPPLWRPAGLVFRVRLLCIRGARHWLPVLLLAVFVLVALIYWLLSGGGGNTLLAHSLKEAAADFNGGVTPRVDESAKPYLALLPLLVSLVTGGVTLWRGAKAFGVSPASLMASMSRGVRVRDLDAQTSFRQRFASEFNDATKALGARSMIVFIDDLDRCRPENVVETLEAVNFLVTSGECFVVIGMARARVEPCVGLSFKDVAAEMLDAGEAEEAPPAGADKEETKRLQESRARQKRLEYARQYLDKLINIEVPVPVPTPEQSCGILVANARRAEEQADAPEPPWRRLLPSGAEALARDYGRLLLWCAGLVLLLSASYELASFLAHPMALTEATRVPSPSFTPTPAPTLTPTPAPTPTPTGSATPTPLPSPTPASPPVNMPELIPGRRSARLAAAPVLLVVLAVLWVGFWVLTRRPGLVVKDSPKFVEALTVWHPLVFARSSTPRSVKRFMNRVRYLAMRQRRQKDDPPAWRRLLRRFAAAEETDAAGSEKATLNNSAAPIPDELLVALAAIQHYKASWLLSPGILFSAPSRTAARAKLSEAGISTADWDLLQTVKGEHARKFGGWDMDEVAAARDEFLKISKGVQVN